MSIEPIVRFPRMNLDVRAVLFERILHHSYNSMASKRSHWHWANNQRLDVYKLRRMGNKAQFYFLLLAQKLSEEGVSPVSYLKTMFNHGPWAKGNFLPPPHVLAHDNSIQRFFSHYEQDLQKYGNLKEVEKSSTRVNPDHKQIIFEVKDSAQKVREVAKNFKLSEEDAVLGQIMELSPWYLAVSEPFLKNSGILLLAGNRRKEVKGSMEYLLGHKTTFKAALKAVKA